MAKTELLQNRFNYGQVDENFENQFDAEPFFQSLRFIKNWIVDGAASLMTRPGTRFLETIGGGGTALDPMLDAIQLIPLGDLMLEIREGQIYPWFHTNQELHRGNIDSPPPATEYATTPLSYTSTDDERLYVTKIGNARAVRSEDTIYVADTAGIQAYSWTKVYTAGIVTTGLLAVSGPAFGSRAKDLTIYNQRLYLVSGNNLKASEVGNLTNFTPGTLPNDPIDVNIEGMIYATALMATDRILIGAVDGERLITGEDGVVTIDNINPRKYTNHWIHDIKPEHSGNKVVFVQGGGRSVREYYYNDVSKNYDSPDLTIGNEEYLTIGITQVVLIKRQIDYLFFLLEDETVAVMALDAQRKIRAWHRLDFGGEVKALGSITTDSNRQSLIVVVARYEGKDAAGNDQVRLNAEELTFDEPVPLDSYVTKSAGAAQAITAIETGSTTKIYVADPATPGTGTMKLLSLPGLDEYEGRYGTIAGYNVSEGWIELNIDSTDWTGNLTADGSVAPAINSVAIADFAHLRGMNVDVIGDGIYIGSYEIAYDATGISFSDYHSELMIGLNFEAEFSTHKLIPTNQIGKAMGGEIRPSTVILSLKDSFGGSIESGGVESDIQYDVPVDIPTIRAKDYRKTEETRTPVDAGSGNDPIITVKQYEPWHMYIQAMSVEVDVHD